MSSPATITAEELAALIAERDALAGALRVATTERDLALQRLRSLQRQLFAAESEARGTEQKNLFLNEAEALAPTDQTPSAQTDEEESTPVAGHQRKKRGRKPLDPALVREIVRHPRAGCRVKHPCRNDDNDTGRGLDVNYLTSGPLLAVLPPHSAPIQRIPPVENLDFLRDMRRMTL